LRPRLWIQASFAQNLQPSVWYFAGDDNLAHFDETQAASLDKPLSIFSLSMPL